VMICDDELDVLRAYKIALGSRFNVMTAVSGEDCLEIYSKSVESKKKIDLIVVDYRLGDTLGDELAQKLQKIAVTKVLLLTAFEMEPDYVNKLRRENVISTFLKKPVSLGSLIGTISELVGT
jgi:response regulator RpfG family c-di-GMP phosphodiesterase